MCIICVQFNKNRDIRDAEVMIEAARREADIVPEEHLAKIELALREMDENHTKEIKVT